MNLITLRVTLENLRPHVISDAPRSHQPHYMLHLTPQHAQWLLSTLGICSIRLAMPWNTWKASLECALKHPLARLPSFPGIESTHPFLQYPDQEGVLFNMFQLSVGR